MNHRACQGVPCRLYSAILQFINRIIVTLHFFFGSKLFYFSKIFEFWLQILNGKGRFSGGRNRQKSPNYNRGAGGAPKPPRPWETNPRGVCDQIFSSQTVSDYDLLSTPWRFWPATPSYRFWYFCEKTEILPQNRPKRKKTRKSSEWRHIHRVVLCLKFSSSKILGFWFLGRMREILEVHR